MSNLPEASVQVKLHVLDAENVYQVFDWLWCSAQLTEKDIAKLPALGIEAVINLAAPTASNAMPGEAKLVAGQGITYIQIPVAWEQPRLSQLEQFFGVLQAFEGHKIWCIAQKICEHPRSFISIAGCTFGGRGGDCIVSDARNLDAESHLASVCS